MALRPKCSNKWLKLLQNMKIILKLYVHLFSHGPHFTAGIDLPKIAPYMKSGNREYLHPKNLIDPLSLRGLIRTKPVVCAVRGIIFTCE